MAIHQVITPMPDVEAALMFALVPMEPDIRFVTVMPAGDLPMITARIKRSSGGGARGSGSWWMDQPTVDIDVWGSSTEAMNVSIAARSIQADILSLMGVQVMNGVIQRVATISGPRSLPEANPTLVRYNATYEVRIHP
jgi:hypothetical protein